MPPRTRNSIHAAFASTPPYTLSNTRESYRDLLIFEERLKQNSARLASQRRKYEAFLLSLVLSILLLAYRVFLVPSPYKPVQFLNSGLLLIGLVTLILFFATGVYSEKIAYAYKFVPQANRALRYFNIYLNTKQPPRSWSMNPFRLFRSSAASPSSDNTDSSLSRSPSVSSSTASRSPSPRSKLAAGRSTIPLAPIPPSQNPRGELIFSSKVGPGFREGYEKYRNEWEKRRKPGRGEMSWYKWMKGFVVAEKGKSKEASQSAPQQRAMKVEGNEKIDTAPSFRNEVQEKEAQSVPGVDVSSISSNNNRGRDNRARPLLRSNSSSSASSSYSISPPASRQPSPLRNPLLSDISRASSPTSSSRRSTPDLIREEDEDYFVQERMGRGGVGSNSESSLASLGREGRRGRSEESGGPISPEREDEGWTTKKGRGGMKVRRYEDREEEQ